VFGKDMIHKNEFFKKIEIEFRKENNLIHKSIEKDKQLSNLTNIWLQTM
jgi:hypothetical protein